MPDRFMTWGGPALVMIAIVGCTMHVRPPAQVREPATVYLVDYGLHSSLVLPRAVDPADEPDVLNRTEGQVEYAYGEWQYFALRRNNWLDALRAALIPTQGTLGRRILETSLNRRQLHAQLAAETVYPLTVEAARARNLTAELNQSFDQRRETLIRNETYEMAFVHYDESYWLPNHCNVATERWLRQLGCELSGLSLLSDFRIVETEREAQTPLGLVRRVVYPFR